MNSLTKSAQVADGSTKKSSSPRILDRRLLLRGAGAAIALPLLNAMTPAPVAFGATASTAAKSPVRLAWIFFPNGTNAREWLTKADGDSWKVSSSLEPLAKHRSDISVLRGLAQINASALGDGSGDQARSAAAFLTGAHPLKTAGSLIRVGQSIDQVVAETYGAQTRLSSIELGTEDGRSAGSCDSGYACAYSNNISWRSASQPMAKEIDPRRAFERLFGATNSGVSDDTARRLAMRKSVLDSVRDSARQLTNRLGRDDRQKLDEYFNSLREVEQRIERSSSPISLEGLDVAVPTGKPEDMTEHIRLMYDLMVLAFQTDATRVASFMLSNEGSGRSFRMIDVKEGHHQLSHHQEKVDSMEKVARIDRYYCEQFAYFIDRLKNTRDGENGNLLDNSLIVYGGAISDGNKHNHHDLPILLAGRGGGTHTSGRFHQFEKDTPLNNLYVTMAQSCGVDIKELGDSTGTLSGLT